MPMLMSVRMRRWKEEMGRRSRRAPAVTLKSDSLFSREGGPGAPREGFDRPGPIFFERIGLRGEEKVFAAAGGGRVEFQDAGDEGVGLGGKIGGGNDLRDQADFESLPGRKRLAEKYERKGEARQGVFAEVRHDRGGGGAMAHFWKTKGSGVCYQREVGDGGEGQAGGAGGALGFGPGD